MLGRGIGQLTKILMAGLACNKSLTLVLKSLVFLVMVATMVLDVAYSDKMDPRHDIKTTSYVLALVRASQNIDQVVVTSCSGSKCRSGTGWTYVSK